MSDLEEPLPGKEYHRKEKRHEKHLQNSYNIVKYSGYVRKTVNTTDGMTKKQITQLKSANTDNMTPGVFYSLNKKNRFRDFNTHDLLVSAPDDVDAEVQEHNIHVYSDANLTAVHTRKLEEDSLDITVETATTSSLKGQDYSNFLTEKQRAEKKAQSQEDADSKPCVTYHVYKANGVSNNMADYYHNPKVRRNRGNKRIDADEEYYQYHRTIDDSVDIFYNPDEDGEPHQSEFTLNLGDLVISEKPLKKRKQQGSECSSQFEVVDLEDVDTMTSGDSQDFPRDFSFPQVTNISDVLKTVGYTFQQFNASFDQIPELEFNFEREIDKIKSDERFLVKDLRPKQYLIDATKYFNIWNPDKIDIMESTVVIVVTYLKKNQVNVLINSTIAENVSKNNVDICKAAISKSQSLWHAVQTITVEQAENSGDVERMKLSSSFFGGKTISEMLHTLEAWLNQLPKNVHPNLFDHQSWTTASELMNTGTRVEWAVICEMLGEIRQPGTKYPSVEDTCHVCQKRKPGHELYWIKNQEKRVECSECLRDKFYKEFSAGRLPIELNTETAVELEYLSAFIPLTILNLYIRMLAKEVYRDVGIDSHIEKCPQCRAVVLFDSTDNQNLSCPCGYCWCQSCKDVPHWPMTCEVYKVWSKKWEFRYNMETAQGSGTDTLMQITCECQNAIFYAKTPTDTVECPMCKLVLRTSNWVWENNYLTGGWTPNFRKRLLTGKTCKENFISRTVHLPFAIVETQIAKIPNIKASVIKTCKAARDLRFDLETRNELLRKERQLIRDNVLGEKAIGGLLSTSVYLVEMVAGWMFESKNGDKHTSNVLDDVLKVREELVNALKEDNRENIVTGVEKLQKRNKLVIELVARKQRIF